MKKYHCGRKIKFGILFQLFAISYLSFCIVTLATSSTAASFHSETGTLEGDISAADTFAESEEDEADEETEDTSENEANTESTDDADKPSEENEAEESEEYEEDTETTGDE